VAASKCSTIRTQLSEGALAGDDLADDCMPARSPVRCLTWQGAPTCRRSHRPGNPTRIFDWIGAADALAVEMPSMARRPTNCINKGQELDSAYTVKQLSIPQDGMYMCSVWADVKWSARNKPASTQRNAHQLVRRGEAQRDGCLCALADRCLELRLTKQPYTVCCRICKHCTITGTRDFSC
jgi:hypothetical protein